jgi:hypothetical protein
MERSNATGETSLNLPVTTSQPAYAGICKVKGISIYPEYLFPLLKKVELIKSDGRGKW